MELDFDVKLAIQTLTENYGYINYPFIKNHIELLKIIRELEIKYCRDHE